MTQYTYLGSSYSHEAPYERERRYLEALAAFSWLSLKGIHAYSPIVHCHEMAKLFKAPTDGEWWYDHNVALLKPASSLTIFRNSGWTLSKGLRAEITFAVREELPFFFLTQTDEFFRDFKIEETNKKELELRLGCLT